MGLDSGALVGRQFELDLLQHLLESLPQVGTRAVEISGVPGIGKTALLQSLASQAIDTDHLVLTATGARSEHSIQFGGTLHLFDAALCQPELVQRFDPYDISDLADVLPGMRPYSTIQSDAGQSDAGTINPLIICRALARCLSVMAADYSGLVLIADDQQWADDSSWFVLDHLIRHGIGAPLLIATGTRRSAAAQRRLHTSDFRTRVDLIELGPLDSDSTQILASDIPTDLRDAALKQAAGNPFYLKELASYVARIGASAERDLQDQPEPGPQQLYPPIVIAAITSEVSELTEPAQRLVDAASVVGNPFQLEIAADLAGIQQAESFAAIDEMVTNSVASPTRTPAEFTFRHPVVASVIYHSLGAGELLGMHAHAAEILRDSGASLPTIARHLELSATVGDEGAIDTIVKAAEESLALTPNTAAHLFESAIRLTPSNGPLADNRFGLLNVWIDSLVRAGRHEEAASELDRALKTKSYSWQQRALLLAASFRIARWLGRDNGILDLLRTTLDELPESAIVERSLLNMMLMLESADRGDVPAMREYATSADAQTSTLPPVWRVPFVAGIAAMEAWVGSTARARQYASEAADLISKLSHEETAFISSESLLMLASADLTLGDYEDALEHAQVGSQIAATTGNRLLEFTFGLIAEDALFVLGRFGAAEELLSDIEQIARSVNYESGVNVAIARRSTLAAMLGDWSDAETAIAQSKQYLDETNSTGTGMIRRSESISASLRVARAYALLGQPEPAITLLRSLVDSPMTTHVGNIVKPQLYEQLSSASLLAGDPVQAREWADQAIASATDVNTMVAQLCAYRAQAEVLLAEGDLANAEQAASTAVAAGQTLNAPVETALALIIQAHVFLASGHPEQAKEALLRAATDAQASGAKRVAALAYAQLRKLGIRGIEHLANEAGGGDQLSQRELEVATLVAHGLSNREVAARLFLSSRTVESHLSRIFDKLAVNSRTQLARKLKSET